MKSLRSLTKRDRQLAAENAELEARQAYRTVERWGYKSYIQSPEWKARRDRVVAVYGGRCYCCSEQTQFLDVHHRTYRRLGKERPDDLVPVCRRCHQLIHEIARTQGVSLVTATAIRRKKGRRRTARNQAKAVTR